MVSDKPGAIHIVASIACVELIFQTVIGFFIRLSPKSASLQNNFRQKNLVLILVKL